ncbi:MAG: MBL fold metallo-hydrolase [Bacteroidales bacterium]|nr:MAG: MBL fold metallo-hydrolase [Bacteroidales bacterium]
MKTKILFILTLLLLGSFVINAQKITILYDNYIHDDDCRADWGFSCIVDHKAKSLLFDTGTKKDVFVYNLTKLKENLGRVDMIVISHNHGDHAGNLYTVLETKNDLTVYMPFSTPDTEIKMIKETGASVVQDKRPRDLGNDWFLSGELGGMIKEQALIMDTPKGLVIITGCAHPGISEIVAHVKEIYKKDIYLVLGGFHLLDLPENEIGNIIQDLKDMGVRNVAPTHCTGDKAIEMFEEAYGENFIRIGVGKELEI